MVFLWFMFFLVSHSSLVFSNLSISVYYESLCPDSRLFITEKLLPTYKRFWNQNINLTLIPYGFATTSMRGNEIVFKCQHLEPECELNKLHACLVSVDSISDMHKLEQVSCFMEEGQSEDNPLQVLEVCNDKKLFDHVYDSVYNCYSNKTIANNLLKYFGTITIPEQLQFIPTVYLNGKKNKDIRKQLEIQENFLEEVEKLL